MTRTAEATGKTTAGPGSSSGGMVVGIDGSPGSNHALAWAAARTEHFGPIQPLATWQYPLWAVPPPVFGAPPTLTPEDFAEEARRQAEEIVKSVEEVPKLPLVVSRSAAGPALVKQGAKTGLIVVGTRGRGAVSDALLGSVSCHVVAHATVPVAVVPVNSSIENPYRRVIVGVDGSSNSISALAWAIRNTPATSTIEAIHTWSYYITAIPGPYAVRVETVAEEAKQRLDLAVKKARTEADCPGSDRKIVLTSENGDPRKTLREASREADLLVLGAQGSRGVAHLLMGSVATGLVHQPLTTTVVVPKGR